MAMCSRNRAVKIIENHTGAAFVEQLPPKAR